MKQEEIIILIDNIVLNHWFPLAEKLEWECSPSMRLMTILLIKRSDLSKEGVIIPNQYFDKIITLLNGNQKDDYALSIELFKGFGVKESALQALFPNLFNELCNHCFQQLEVTIQMIEDEFISNRRLMEIKAEMDLLKNQIQKVDNDNALKDRIEFIKLEEEFQKIVEPFTSYPGNRLLEATEVIYACFFKIINQEISGTDLRSAVYGLKMKLWDKITSKIK